MIKQFKFLPALFCILIPLVCQAGDLDTSKFPKDQEIGKITKMMLETGEEIAYRNDHENQRLWIFQPADLEEGDLRPCIFFIHGGGWEGSPVLLAPQSLYFAQRGMVSVSIHFREPNPSPKDCLADCLSAYRWVKRNGKQYNIDVDRIIVSGGSAGGHLALAMLTIPNCDNPDDDLSVPIDPKALILFNPVIDLVEGWKEGVKKCQKAGIDPASFSPAHRVKPGLPETHILSGGKDKNIPPELIYKFMDRMKENGNKCSFVFYPEGEHGFFNYGRHDNKYFKLTVAEADKIITGLGYLPIPKLGENPPGKN